MIKARTLNIVHLEIDGKHEYFGSPASLYDIHSAEELGITQASLNNHFYKLKEEEEKIYRNKKCVIRKGTVYLKPKRKLDH